MYLFIYLFEPMQVQKSVKEKHIGETGASCHAFI